MTDKKKSFIDFITKNRKCSKFKLVPKGERLSVKFDRTVHIGNCIKEINHLIDQYNALTS